MNATKYTACLVLAPRDPEVCLPIGEALLSLGIDTQRLVTHHDRPEAVIARADVEGGVPIVIAWSDRSENVSFVCDLLSADTLPGRPYVVIAPNDVSAAVIAEELESNDSVDSERVLVVSATDLEAATTRELLSMHLSRSCAAYLGRPRKARGVTPATFTEMPVSERVINNIERRAMQRGQFRVQALRMPSF